MAVDVACPADVTNMLVRLAELGPPSELRKQSPALAASTLDLDRVLLTSISGGTLVAEALHPAGTGVYDPLTPLRESMVALEYPLVEGEIMRRRRAQVVHADDGDSAARHAFSDVLGWTEYAVAPIVLDGTVIGFFHGDRHASGRSVDENDANTLSAFAVCFGLVYERAVLRHRLRVQRQEMRQVASWADARTSELGDRSISLAEEPDGAGAREGTTVQPSGRSGEGALRDLLTRRELDVLRLMVGGQTNSGIARELVVSEGTVKFHVKNILRKLHAANRAEATSRYLRLTLNRGS
jgi:DNA-binding CsgD family transcriptional regulator